MQCSYVSHTWALLIFTSISQKKQPGIRHRRVRQSNVLPAGGQPNCCTAGTGPSVRWTPEALAQERRLSSVTANRQPPGSRAHREYLSLLQPRSLERLERRASWFFSYEYFTVLSRGTNALYAGREEQQIEWSMCMSFKPVSYAKTSLCMC